MSIYAERMCMVAKATREAPPENFNMATWFAPTRDPECGTAACAWGHFLVTDYAHKDGWQTFQVRPHQVTDPNRTRLANFLFGERYHKKWQTSWGLCGTGVTDETSLSYDDIGKSMNHATKYLGLEKTEFASLVTTGLGDIYTGRTRQEYVARKWEDMAKAKWPEYFNKVIPFKGKDVFGTSLYEQVQRRRQAV